ncbi:MAG: helix-turn-helix domain-containing protein [Lachnospiraceae bacterium]|jgi:xylan 1,4-beta-xylosidase|nr:helix-turn-helix domain-containing protein [Lachnospiraceae bacterium]
MYYHTHLSGYLDVRYLAVTFTSEEKDSYWHFLLVLRGEVSLRRRGREDRCGQGDIVLFPPGTQRTLNRISENECLDIVLDDVFMQSAARPGSAVVCDSVEHPGGHDAELAARLQEISIAYNEGSTSPALYSALFALQTCLQANYLTSRQETAGSEGSAAEQIAQIHRLLEENYTEGYTLQQLSEDLSQSKSSLADLIRREDHSTFTKLLRQVRLSHAVDELTASDAPVSQIAIDSGFPSLSAFGRAFESRYRMAPAKFRLALLQERKSAPEPAAGTAPSAAAQDSAGGPVSASAPVLSAAPAPPAAETTTASPPGIQDESPVPAVPLRADVRETFAVETRSALFDTINIGELSSIFAPSNLDTLREAQARLHFRYVRFQNLFSAEIMEYIEESGNFDFSSLDRILDLFLSMGLTPFIELTPKPEKTGIRGFLRAGRPDSRVNEEPSDDYCLRALSALLRHELHRCGRSYLSAWRFEVWMKYDDGLVQPRESTAAYFSRYLSFRSLIRKELPGCLVGGPGFNAVRNAELFAEFLRAAEKSNAPFDFLSVYIYGYESGAISAQFSGHSVPYPTLPADGHYLQRSYRRLSALKDATSYRETPLFVTEFNSLLSANSFIPFSPYMGPFLAVSVSDFIGSGCACLAFFLLFDSYAGVLNDYRGFYLGCGMFDVRGIQKISFLAAVFLSRMGGRIIACGPNYMVTSTDENKWQLLAWQYVHFTSAYRLSHIHYLPMPQTYEAFRQDAPTRLSVELTGLPPGRCRILSHRLGRHKGSLLDHYLDILQSGRADEEDLLDCLNFMTREDEDMSRKLVEPQHRLAVVKTEGTLTLNVELEPFDLCLFEIQHLLPQSGRSR